MSSHSTRLLFQTHKHGGSGFDMPRSVTFACHVVHEYHVPAPKSSSFTIAGAELPDPGQGNEPLPSWGGMKID